MISNWLEFVNNVSILQQSYIDDIVTIYGFCEYPIHRDVTMLASMCKLKVGRLSREVGFFSMMLMFIMYFDVSDVHEDYVCDVDVYCVC